MKTKPKKTSTSEDHWKAFLEKIGAARIKCGCEEIRKDGTPGEEAWFRGHTRSDYPLMPSLLRGFADPNDSDWQRIFNIESDLFWEFAARARELHGVIEDDWDILFAMQHYGTPTRLLDWTETLAVAIYFAVLNVDESKPINSKGMQRDANGKDVPPPCVWVLNPYKLNDNKRWVTKGGQPDMVHPGYLGWDAEENDTYTYGDLLSFGKMDWDWPTAIYPRQKNSRMHAQRAWFTIHGDSFIAMEKRKNREKYLQQVELPFRAVGEAKKFLSLAGINDYLLFADLESLSLHLQEKNGLVSRAQAEAKTIARISRRDIVPQNFKKGV